MAFTYKDTDEVKAAKKQQAQDETNLRNFQTYQPGTYTQSDELKGMWNNISNWQTPTWDKSNNTWWNKLTDTMNAIENREKFSYDVNGDALYQQYKDQYTTQGKMAMMDTMGQASAMTGGYGNSYAQSVGQQAYQGYLQQLTDKIPELYSLALDKYNSEGDEMYNKLSSYGNLYSTEYGEHRDAVADSKDQLSHLTNLYGIKSNEEYDQWYDGEQMNMTANQQAYNKLADLLGISTEAAKTLYDNTYKSQLDTYTTKYNESRDDVADSQWSKEFEASTGYTPSGQKSTTYAKEEEFTPYQYAYKNSDGQTVFTYDGKEVKVQTGTNPYTRTKNPDTKYGTFDNGYQPNNVNGKKLSKTGQTDVVNGVTQNVWKTPDGTKYIWDGTKNAYLRYED